VEFAYQRSPELSAELVFDNEDELSAKLKLFPVDDNPHIPVRSDLENGYNKAGGRGFEGLAYVIPCTLPIVQAFANMEKKDPSKHVVAMHPRSVSWFVFRYHAPLLECSYTVKSHLRRENGKKLVQWLIQDIRTSAPGGTLPAELIKSIKQLWQDGGERWMDTTSSTATGCVADPAHIAEVMDKLDELIRNCPVEAAATQAEDSTQQSTKSEPPAAQSAKPQQPKAPNQQQKPAPKPVKQEPDVILLD
jgi:hypothetical protein